jgi:ribonuclease P protein component
MPSQADSRFPGALPHQKRSRGAPPPSRQGAQEISRLVWNKERRLLKSPEFKACYDRGRKQFTRSFILFVLRRKEGPSTIRLGLTVSKKMGNAVARNRIKRVVREYFRLHQYDFELPLDIVVVPKRNLEAGQLTLALATEELTPLLTRTKAEAAAS